MIEGPAFTSSTWPASLLLHLRFLLSELNSALRVILIQPLIRLRILRDPLFMCLLQQPVYISVSIKAHVIK